MSQGSQLATQSGEPGGPGAGPGDDRRAGRSPGRIAWERLRRDKVAIGSTLIVVFFVVVALAAPLLTTLSGNTLNAFNPDLISARNTLPVIGSTSSHWFGVEPRTGRDLFTLWAYGARPSLAIGFIAAVASTVVGVVLGLVAGYLGGVADRVISWVIDFLLCVPVLILVIAIVPIVTNRVGGGEILSSEETSTVRFNTLIVILVVFGWTGLARLIRGEVLSLREREFVQAAKVIGVPTRQILFREILPNLVGPIIVSASIAVPAYITYEATLSFLGAGLVEPTASWGRTVALAQNTYAAYPLYLWPSVVAIALLVLALSLLGESVRDAFDPNTRR
ncbi:ABC transporter permease [Dermatophilaceae bacterium Soc4.6]